jgi:hypothetical protein
MIGKKPILEILNWLSLIKEKSIYEKEIRK